MGYCVVRGYFLILLDTVGVRDLNEVELLGIKNALEVWSSFGQRKQIVEGDSAKCNQVGIQKETSALETYTYGEEGLGDVHHFGCFVRAYPMVGKQFSGIPSKNWGGQGSWRTFCLLISLLRCIGVMLYFLFFSRGSIFFCLFFGTSLLYLVV